MSLKNFAFPFSGKAFNSFSVGNTGSIAFAAEPPADGRVLLLPVATAEAAGRGGAGRGGRRQRNIDRFAQLGRAGATLVKADAGLIAFLAPHVGLPLRQGTRRSRRRHLGPHGALRRHSGLHLDSDREPLPEAVLMKSGEIDLSYQEDDGARWNRRHLSASPRSQQGRRHRTRKGEADGPFPATSIRRSTIGNSCLTQDLTCSVLKELGDPTISSPTTRTSASITRKPALPATDRAAADLPARRDRHRTRAARARKLLHAGRWWQFKTNPCTSVRTRCRNILQKRDLRRTFDVTFYAHEIARRTTNGKLPPYDYAVSQIGHELRAPLGHRMQWRWVNGERIQMGPTHWATGLQAVVPFPFQRPYEASLMGGGVVSRTTSMARSATTTITTCPRPDGRISTSI